MPSDTFWEDEEGRKQLVQELLQMFKITRMITFPEMSPEWGDEGVEELKELTKQYREFYKVYVITCPSYFDAAHEAACMLDDGESLQDMLLDFKDKVSKNEVSLLQNIDEVIERLESKRSKYINTLRSGGLILTVSTDRLHDETYHFMHAIIACQLFRNLQWSDPEIKKLRKDDGTAE